MAIVVVDVDAWNLQLISVTEFQDRTSDNLRLETQRLRSRKAMLLIMSMIKNATEPRAR